MKNLHQYNLENIFREAQRLKLHKTYNYTITQHETIRYDLFLKALNKYGICILTLNYRDNSVTFKQIIQNLGVLHFHKEKDSFLWNIKILKDKPTPLARSHKDHEFHFHTDCSYEENVPDYFALYVLHADKKSGGKNLIVDVKWLVSSLSKESIKTLQESVTIKIPLEFYKGIDFIRAPILDKDFNIRYRREIIEENDLTPKQLKAINELENLIYSPEFCRGIILNDDQILILNNKQYLHARTQIRDPARHLQRVRFFNKPAFASL